MKKELCLVVPVLILGLVFLTGCASDKAVTATADERFLALEGEDIPMGPIDEMDFSEPAPADALILKDIHFDFDKSEIKEPDKEILEGINSWIINKPEAELLIEGHCDERGTKEYNLALGERRALSIRSYLTGLGSSPTRLHTISYGEEQPLCTVSDEACWAENRRGHFQVNYGEGETVAAVEEESLTPEEAQEEIEEIIVVEEPVPEPEPVVEEVEEVEMEEESVKKSRKRVIGRYHY